MRHVAIEPVLVWMSLRRILEGDARELLAAFQHQRQLVSGMDEVRHLAALRPFVETALAPLRVEADVEMAGDRGDFVGLERVEEIEIRIVRRSVAQQGTQFLRTLDHEQSLEGRMPEIRVDRLQDEAARWRGHRRAPIL